MAEDVIRFVEPLKEKIEDLHKNEDYLNKVLQQGAEKAKESAGKTIHDVREIIGFKTF